MCVWKWYVWLQLKYKIIYVYMASSWKFTFIHASHIMFSSCRRTLLCKNIMLHHCPMPYCSHVLIQIYFLFRSRYMISVYGHHMTMSVPNHCQDDRHMKGFHTRPTKASVSWWNLKYFAKGSYTQEIIKVSFDMYYRVASCGTIYMYMIVSSQGAVSIRKTVFPGMAIPMLKIRRPSGRLIFNMEIAIRR